MSLQKISALLLTAISKSAERRVKVMVEGSGSSRRRSMAQVVIGLAPEDSFALRDEDLNFYGDVSCESSYDSSDGSSDSSPGEISRMTCLAMLRKI